LQEIITLLACSFAYFPAGYYPTEDRLLSFAQLPSLPLRKMFLAEQ